MRFSAAVMFAVLLSGQAVFAQSAVSGRIAVPAALMPYVAGTTITSVFGAPLGQIDTTGQFTMPGALSADMDMLFVRDHRGEVVLLGYAYDQFASIGIDSTALALLMMFNPANGALDLDGKKQLLQAYRAHADFPRLVAAVQKTVSSNSDVATPDDQVTTQLLATIQATTPRPQQAGAALSDPMMLMAR